MLSAARLSELDPRGIWTPADLLAECEQSLCVGVTSGGGQGVYAVQAQNGVAWVAAAAGEGADWTRLGLGAIEAHAAGDCEAVAFMTARRGLVLKASRLGYRVTGYVLRKELKRWT